MPAPEAKPLTTPIGIGVGWLVVFIVTRSVAPLQNAIGEAHVFFLFAIVCQIGKRMFCS